MQVKGSDLAGPRVIGDQVQGFHLFAHPERLGLVDATSNLIGVEWVEAAHPGENARAAHHLGREQVLHDQHVELAPRSRDLLGVGLLRLQESCAQHFLAGRQRGQTRPGRVGEPHQAIEVGCATWAYDLHGLHLPGLRV